MEATRLWTTFTHQVEALWDAAALVWQGEEVSYGELHSLACDAHARIAQSHPNPNEVVAMPAVKSPETIATVLACLRASRPVVLAAPTLPPATLQKLFAEAAHALDLNHDEAALILTTSGSTGLPKLVPISATAVERFVDWAGTQFDLGPDSSVLNYAPLNFDLCLLDIWTTLLHGGQVVLVDPDKATNGEHVLGLISERHVNVVQAVPMLFRLLVDAAGDQPPQFASVEHVIFTGDHMPPKVLTKLPELFPRGRLYNIYGCTETNDSFIYEVRQPDLPRPSQPLGRPLPGVQALIVDDDGAVVSGPGRGELLVATPFQTSGYLHAPGSGNGADKFVVRHHGDRTLRYFRTGDIVRRDATGQVQLEGRNDFQVKVRGTRVNTVEVEKVLLEHDGVVEAAVVAVPDPVAGHLLHSVVYRAPAAQLNSLVLRQHCAERMPRAAIPSTLRLVNEPLPKTSTGKVDRKALLGRDEGRQAPESTVPQTALKGEMHDATRRHHQEVPHRGVLA